MPIDTALLNNDHIVLHDKLITKQQIYARDTIKQSICSIYAALYNYLEKNSKKLVTFFDIITEVMQISAVEDIQILDELIAKCGLVIDNDVIRAYSYMLFLHTMLLHIDLHKENISPATCYKILSALRTTYIETSHQYAKQKINNKKEIWLSSSLIKTVILLIGLCIVIACGAYIYNYFDPLTKMFMLNQSQKQFFDQQKASMDMQIRQIQRDLVTITETMNRTSQNTNVTLQTLSESMQKAQPLANYIIIPDHVFRQQQTAHQVNPLANQK